MLSRCMIRQVEATAIAQEGVIPKTSASVDKDPRVVNEGSGWYLVDGERVHGRKGVDKALAETGG